MRAFAGLHFLLIIPMIVSACYQRYTKETATPTQVDQEQALHPNQYAGEVYQAASSDEQESAAPAQPQEETVPVPFLFRSDPIPESESDGMVPVLTFSGGPAKQIMRQMQVKPDPSAVPPATRESIDVNPSLTLRQKKYVFKVLDDYYRFIVNNYKRLRRRHALRK